MALITSVTGAVIDARLAQAGEFWAAADGEGATYSANPWDMVSFGAGAELQTPGLARVKCMPQFQCDKHKARDEDGARLILHGFAPCTVDIEVTIWTLAQLRAMNALLGKIWRLP